MSRKPSFANLRDRTPPETVAPVAETRPASQSGPASRQGRKQIADFFTPRNVVRDAHAGETTGRSLRALMAEAFNDVLCKNGESPIGD